MSHKFVPFLFYRVHFFIIHPIRSVNGDSVPNLEETKKVICNSHITGIELKIQEAQNTIFQKTDEVKTKVTTSTAKNILESFKIPEFPSSINRMMAEVADIDAEIDDDILHRNAQNAHRVEYETKTKTEYREKTRTKYRTERRKKSGLWSSFKRFFGAGGYEDVEVPYEETFKEPYEVSYQVSHDVYDIEKFKNSIANELQNRISKVIDEAHDKMESAIREDIKNIFENVKNQCEEICNSYSKLYNDFEKDINMASDETDAHRKALERDIETFLNIKENLQHFFKTWNDILYSNTDR